MFYTEKAHVRNLKVMHKLFCQAMLAEPWIPDDLVKLLFPNIEEMIKVHGQSHEPSHNVLKLISHVTSAFAFSSNVKNGFYGNK